MNFSAITALYLFASLAQARSPRVPDPAVLLRLSLEPCSVSYEGRVKVETFISSGAPVSRRLSVHFSPPGLYRREIIGPGAASLQLIISNAHEQWVYDPTRHKAWHSPPSARPADEEFSRLIARYAISISSGARVARRSVWVIDLRTRADLSVSRRLWVDRRYGLILKSVLFGPDGGPAVEERFTQIKFNAEQDPNLFAFVPPSDSSIAQRLTVDVSSETLILQGLKPRVPAWLPLGYVLQSVGSVDYNGASLLQYRFSDGLNALSLFEWRSGVDVDLGRRAREESGLFRWSSEGINFVLIGLLPTETLRHVADSVAEQIP